MKKVLIGLLAVIAVAASVFVGAVMMQPAHTHIERSVVVQGTPADVFPLINDYQAFVKWSPWSGLDPNQKVEFSTPSTGKDAWYTWDGNDDVAVFTPPHPAAPLAQGGGYVREKLSSASLVGRRAYSHGAELAHWVKCLESPCTP